MESVGEMEVEVMGGYFSISIRLQQIGFPATFLLPKYIFFRSAIVLVVFKYLHRTKQVYHTSSLSHTVVSPESHVPKDCLPSFALASV